MTPQPIKRISVLKDRPQIREIEMFVDSEETLRVVTQFGQTSFHNKNNGYLCLTVSGLYNFDEVVSYLENLQ